MSNENRPHSRQKNVGSGSANIGKGRQVGGSGFVGFGGRGASGSGQRSNETGPHRGLPTGKLNFKTILILVAAVILIVVLLKKCGGSLFPLSPSDPGTNGNSSYAENNNSSYKEPDTTVSSLARDKYYTPVGNRNDTVTIMVYMCGTDLESKYGMATKDLNEMLNATISDKVNLLVETGGCSKWQNSTISSSVNQIYKVGSKSLKPIESNFGTAAMTDPANLTRFIQYCTSHYPADRNILIFWDHGGGSISGYGYDEKNPGSSSMTLSKINSALKNAGCKFDFIGFDACLMATLETDLVCNNYADYLVASEETEPGTGWYYTNWLSMLSENTSVSTVLLSQKIIDDFIDSSCASKTNAQVTLSVVDLAELDGTIPDTLRDFAASTNSMIRTDQYKTVANARADARQFSPKSKLNQIDLIDFAQRVGTSEANALAKALHGCVKYNKTTIARSNGISMYFPYENTKTVKSAIASCSEIGSDADYAECMEEYTRCMQSFASLEYGGQIAGSASQVTAPTSNPGGLLDSLISSSISGTSSTSPVSVLSGLFTGGGTGSGSAGMGLDAASIISLLSGFSGRSMPSAYSWVDTDLIASNADRIAKQFVDPSRITATQKNGRKVLSLTDDEWKLIQTVELNVFVKDGDGYLDLGLDNTFDWLNDTDLLLEYDGTWLTLNGNACAYYLVSDTQQNDGTWVTVGRIPALLNGRLVNLQVVFDSDHPDGAVTGAYPLYDGSVIDVQAKGNVPVKQGDRIELLCDRYNADGTYSASYTLGSSFTVPGNGLALRNLKINAEDVSVTYRLTDCFGNHFWIEVE